MISEILSIIGLWIMLGFTFAVPFGFASDEMENLHWLEKLILAVLYLPWIFIIVVYFIINNIKVKIHEK